MRVCPLSTESVSEVRAACSDHISSFVNSSDLIVVRGAQTQMTKLGCFCHPVVELFCKMWHRFFARYLHEVPLCLNPKSGWFLGANEKKNVSLSALYRFISRRLFFPVKISSFALFSSSNVQWLHFQSSASVANVPSSANISFRKVFFS